MKRLLLALFLLLFLVSVSYGGTYYWLNGEIVRGGDFLNAAFDEKMDVADYLVGTPQNVAASNTVVVPAGHLFIRITENGATNNNLLSLPTASEGSILFVNNQDTEITTGAASITTGHVGLLLYASSTWTAMVDQKKEPHPYVQYGIVNATNTLSIPATFSYIQIQDNATDSTNIISAASFAPGGTEGQIINIFNGDASSTSGLATITTLKLGSMMYASAAWRLLSDE